MTFTCGLQLIRCKVGNAGIDSAFFFFAIHVYLDATGSYFTIAFAFGTVAMIAVHFIECLAIGKHSGRRVEGILQGSRKRQAVFTQAVREPSMLVPAHGIGSR